MKGIDWIFLLGSVFCNVVVFCLGHSAGCPEFSNSKVICCSFQEPMSKILVIISNILLLILCNFLLGHNSCARDKCVTTVVAKIPKNYSPLLVIIKDIFPENLKGQTLNKLVF